MSTSTLTPESPAELARRWARECAQMAALPLVRPRSARIGRLYDIVGTQNLFGEDSLFINLGYWQNNPGTLDEASKDLARLVAREAELGPDDVQVDVGCGYGDQDFLWAREFGPREITGVNVAVEQIDIANHRAAEYGLADRVRFVRGEASALPQPDASATKVTALESAFHFPSYPAFFAEAFRVLRPGGKLVTADIIPRAQRVTRHYRDNLLSAGFATATVYSIRREVYRPLGRYLSARLRDPQMRQVNPVLRATFSRPGLALWGPWADYIVAVATKEQSAGIL